MTNPPTRSGGRRRGSAKARNRCHEYWSETSLSRVAKDDAEALKWFREAANQGYSRAQYEVGVMYANGEGVKTNAIDAYAWFNIAATAGNDLAERAKGDMSKNMTMEQIAEAEKKSAEILKTIKVPQK